MESIVDIQKSLYGDRKPPPILPHGDDPKAIRPQRKRRYVRKEGIEIPPRTLPRLGELPASDLPDGFPAEYAFRALASYSTLRTLSIPLRLSPFTPHAFLRGLYLPFPNPLIGEVHVTLLRFLLDSLHMGYHWGRQSSSCPLTVTKKRKLDGLRWPLRAGDNLEYLDFLTWPVFYDDYCHLTADGIFASIHDETDFIDHKNLDLSALPPDVPGNYDRTFHGTSGGGSRQRQPARPTILFLNEDRLEDDSEDEYRSDHAVEDEEDDEEFNLEDDADDDEFKIRRPKKRQRVSHKNTDNRPQFQSDDSRIQSERIIPKNGSNILESSLPLNLGVETCAQHNPGTVTWSPETMKTILNGQRQATVPQPTVEFASDWKQQSTPPINPNVTSQSSPDAQRLDRRASLEFSISFKQPMSVQSPSMRRDSPARSVSSNIIETEYLDKDAFMKLLSRRRDQKRLSDNQTKPAVVTSEQSNNDVLVSPAVDTKIVREEETAGEGELCTPVMKSGDGNGVVLEERPLRSCIADSDQGMARSENQNFGNQSLCVTSAIPTEVKPSVSSDLQLGVVTSSMMQYDTGVELSRPLPTQLSEEGKSISDQPSMIVSSMNREANAMPILSGGHSHRQHSHTPTDIDSTCRSTVLPSCVASNTPAELDFHHGNTSGVAAEKIDDVSNECDQHKGRSSEIISVQSGVNESAGSSLQKMNDDDSSASIETSGSDSSDWWPHFIPLRSMRAGTPYHRLSLEQKLQILEFLLDELLQHDVAVTEFSKRHDQHSCFVQPYGELPSKDDLENIENQDECGVCQKEGDLLCCDGCVASYHYTCIDIPPKAPLPEGRWLCPECEVKDPSCYGPLRGGVKTCLDWFSVDDLEYSLCDSSGQFSLAPRATSSAFQQNDQKKYLAVRGFLFERDRHLRLNDDSDGHIKILPLTGLEVASRVTAFGRNIFRKWPLAQINEENENTVVEPQQMTFEQLSRLSSKSDPSNYWNKYRCAPFHDGILKRVKDRHLQNYSVQCFPVSYTGISEVLCGDVNRNEAIVKSLLNSTELFDPHKLIQGFIFKLENTLSKALLLEEQWEFGEIRASWFEETSGSKSVEKLCQLLVILVDHIHPRAFHDGWFDPPDSRILTLQVAQEIPKESKRKQTPSQIDHKMEWKRRQWERCPPSFIAQLVARKNSGLQQWLSDHLPNQSLLEVRTNKRKQSFRFRQELKSLTEKISAADPLDFVPEMHRRRSERTITSEEGERADEKIDAVCDKSQVVAIGVVEDQERLRLLDFLLDFNYFPDKEAHWPLAGRRLYDPVGYLPPRSVRRLARNAGSVHAPHVVYTRLHEVGQVSQYHIWRKRVKNCKSFEELLFYVRMLESFIDNGTIRKCASVAQRANQVKSRKNILCSQTDAYNGLEHFLIGDSSGSDGQWVSVLDVDLTLLISDRAKRRKERPKEKLRQWNPARLKRRNRKRRPFPSSSETVKSQTDNTRSANASSGALEHHKAEALRLVRRYKMNVPDFELQRLRVSSLGLLRQARVSEGIRMSDEQMMAELFAKELDVLASVKSQIPNTLTSPSQQQVTFGSARPPVHCVTVASTPGQNFLATIGQQTTDTFSNNNARCAPNGEPASAFPQQRNFIDPTTFPQSVSEQQKSKLQSTRHMNGPTQQMIKSKLREMLAPRVPPNTQNVQNHTNSLSQMEILQNMGIVQNSRSQVTLGMPTSWTTPCVSSTPLPVSQEVCPGGFATHNVEREAINPYVYSTSSTTEAESSPFERMRTFRLNSSISRALVQDQSLQSLLRQNEGNTLLPHGSTRTAHSTTGFSNSVASGFVHQRPAGFLHQQTDQFSSSGQGALINQNLGPFHASSQNGFTNQSIHLTENQVQYANQSFGGFQSPAQPGFANLSQSAFTNQNLAVVPMQRSPTGFASENQTLFPNQTASGFGSVIMSGAISNQISNQTMDMFSGSQNPMLGVDLEPTPIRTNKTIYSQQMERYQTLNHRTQYN